MINLCISKTSLTFLEILKSKQMLYETNVCVFLLAILFVLSFKTSVIKKTDG